MRITLIVPPARLNLIGNQISGRRYARILRRLGHRVRVDERYCGEHADMLVALHARRSFDSIRMFHRVNPSKPIIIVLTGTDLYRDIATSSRARKSLETATRLVVLQEDGRRRLPRQYEGRCRVIYQSAPPACRNPGTRRSFTICVIGNLRREKDPFRAAMASRLLPVQSTARVIQMGRALCREHQVRALREMVRNPRYRWLGEQPHREARRLLARSHLVAITSRIEGGSNVLSEALAFGVPVIASGIPGLIGTLGESYPGLFPVGDTKLLAALLWRAESNDAFYSRLERHCSRRRALVSPQREIRCWREMLAELGQP
jgi:putative glycosyltransferase (TIGR04348 family)